MSTKTKNRDHQRCWKTTKLEVMTRSMAMKDWNWRPAVAVNQWTRFETRSDLWRPKVNQFENKEDERRWRRWLVEDATEMRNEAETRILKTSGAAWSTVQNQSNNAGKSWSWIKQKTTAWKHQPHRENQIHDKERLSAGEREPDLRTKEDDRSHGGCKVIFQEVFRGKSEGEKKGICKKGKCEKMKENEF